MLSSQRRLKNSGPKFPKVEANVNKKMLELSNLVSQLSKICSMQNATLLLLYGSIDATGPKSL